MTDKVILEWYAKGFRDELYGDSSVVPINPLITKAYDTGANHALLSDEVRKFNYLSEFEILKIIKR